MRLVQEVLEKRMEQEVFTAGARIFELVTTGREGVLGMVGPSEGHEFPLAPKYRVLLSSIVERLIERLKFSFAQYYTPTPPPGPGVCFEYILPSLIKILIFFFLIINKIRGESSSYN